MFSMYVWYTKYPLSFYGLGSNQYWECEDMLCNTYLSLHFVHHRSLMVWSCKRKLLKASNRKSKLRRYEGFPVLLRRYSTLTTDSVYLHLKFRILFNLCTCQPFWGGKCTKFYRKSAVKMNWSYRWFSRWAKFVFHYKCCLEKIGNVQNCLTGKNASKNCVLRAWWDLGKEKLTPAVFGLSFVPSSRSIF